MAEETNLLEFYGEECEPCKEMAVLVEKLEKEEGVKFTKYEVWHNDTNARKLQELDKGTCGGVPFFYNKKTKKTICGKAEYEELKKWALE